MSARYWVMWPDVLTGAEHGHASLTDAMVWAERTYCDDTGDPKDDPDYLQPDLLWRVGWNGDVRNRHQLVANGETTKVYVDDVPDGRPSSRCGGAFCDGTTTAPCPASPVMAVGGAL